jgi:cytochrome c oxidase subunit 2
MLRSIAELAAYGTLAALLIAASLTPESPGTASSAATESTAISAPAITVASSQGALLFATKGCTGCHMHASFPRARMPIGPDLTSLSARAGDRVAGLDAAAYVRQSIREPGAYRVAGFSTLMPDLGLSDAQIEALTAFLLSPKS